MGSSRGSSPQYQPLREDLQAAALAGESGMAPPPASIYSDPAFTNTMSRLQQSGHTLPGGITPTAGGGSATTKPISHLEINKMAQVGKMVPGVSASQCRVALEAVNWDTSIAIKNLKIDKLYRIGVANKPKCEKVLTSVNWDLERAASRLLDE